MSAKYYTKSIITIFTELPLAACFSENAKSPHNKICRQELFKEN